MTRLWLFAALLSGCFYTEPFNQRPSLEIHQNDPGTPVSRGTMASFTAVAIDPDKDSVALTWRAYACHGSACDAVEFDSGADVAFKPVLPMLDAQGQPYDTLGVRLDGHDSLGATARPGQTAVVHLEDADPTLDLRADARVAYVAGQPVGLYAKVGDPDDGPAMVAGEHGEKLEWIAYAPATQQTGMLTDLVLDQDPADPNHLQFGKTFSPGLGDWDIQVSAKDPLDTDETHHRVVGHLPLHVVPDHPPCLAQWDPAATTEPGTTIPISDPTLFQVLVVADDLDPFPSLPNDPIMGTTAFHWSIVPPGGSRQQLTGVTGAGVALDPGSYTPGDLVELRVEIEDRVHTHVNCPDGDLTCSVISDQSCLQRLTWRVEVR